MKKVVTTDEYTIFVKRNGRHAVRNAEHQWVNGEDKVKLLLSHDLIKAPPPKAEPEPQAPAEDSDEAGDSAEASE